MTVRGVLGDTWMLYRRLFARTIAIGAGVFLVVQIPGSLLGVVDSTAAAALLAVVALVLSLVGSLVVQGALSGAVRDVHVGAEERTIAGLYRDTGPRLGVLVGGSLLLVLGIGGAFLLTGLVAVAVIAVAGPIGIPSLLLPLAAVLWLFTRWSLIVARDRARACPRLPRVPPFPSARPRARLDDLPRASASRRPAWCRPEGALPSRECCGGRSP